MMLFFRVHIFLRMRHIPGGFRETRPTVCARAAVTKWRCVAQLTGSSAAVTAEERWKARGTAHTHAHLILRLVVFYRWGTGALTKKRRQRGDAFLISRRATSVPPPAVWRFPYRQPPPQKGRGPSVCQHKTLKSISPPGRASPLDGAAVRRGWPRHIFTLVVRRAAGEPSVVRRLPPNRHHLPSPRIILPAPHKKRRQSFLLLLFFAIPPPVRFFTKQQQSGAQQGSKNTQSASSKQQAAVPKMRGPLCLLRDGQYARHRAFAALPPFLSRTTTCSTGMAGAPTHFCLCVCASAADLTASRPQQRTGADNNIWAQTEKRDHKTPTPRRAFFYFFLLLSLLCLPSFGLFTHHLLNLGLYCTRVCVLVFECVCCGVCCRRAACAGGATHGVHIGGLVLGTCFVFLVVFSASCRLASTRMARFVCKRGRDWWRWRLSRGGSGRQREPPPLHLGMKNMGKHKTALKKGITTSGTRQHF